MCWTARSSPQVICTHVYRMIYNLYPSQFGVAYEILHKTKRENSVGIQRYWSANLYKTWIHKGNTMPALLSLTCWHTFLCTVAWPAVSKWLKYCLSPSCKLTFEGVWMRELTEHKAYDHIIANSPQMSRSRDCPCPTPWTPSAHNLMHLNKINWSGK